MHEADHVIERLAVDRHARVAVLDHAFDDLGEGLIDVERDDIDTRHHHVSRRAVMALQNVADQYPLLRKNIATLESALDLHVLSTPPAFVLSQNQTLR